VERRTSEQLAIMLLLHFACACIVQHPLLTLPIHSAVDDDTVSYATASNAYHALLCACIAQSDKTLRDELKAVEQAALAAQAADAQLFGWGSSAAAAAASSSSSSSISSSAAQQQYGSAKAAPPPPPPPPPLPMEAAAPHDRGTRSDAAAAAVEDASIEQQDDGCYQVTVNCNSLKWC
jgi:hypothetical protein